MKKRKILIDLIIAAAALVFSSCAQDGGSDSGGTTQAATAADSGDTVISTDVDTSKSSDTVPTSTPDNASVKNTVYLDLTDMKWSLDDSTYTSITSDDAVTTDSITISSSSGYISINASSSSGITLFAVNGELDTGTICIAPNKSYAVELYLNGAGIKSGNYPCIEITKASDVYVVTASGTSNVLIDGRTYGYGYGTDYASSSANSVTDGEDTKGSLYAKGQIYFSGSGTLTVSSAYKHGIYSKDTIYVNGGTINVKDSGRNCVQSVNGFIMTAGTIQLVGTGTNTNNQSRGIVVEGDESSSGSGKGYIDISGGTITSTTVGKGMTAKWDIDEDASTSDTSDDPNPYVKISGGTITVTTTGTPKDESSCSYTFTDADGVSTTETTSLSPEGIEGKQDVYISGGTLTLHTTDDAVNASSTSGKVVISGGTMYVFSSDNDAIDSNGTLTISGGTIVAITTTTPECAFDCDSNAFTITGGLLVGMGTSNFSNPTSSVCTQNTVVMASSYAPAGGTMAVCDSSGTPVFAFTVPSLNSVASTGGSSNAYDVLIFSSPNIKSNTDYTVYKNADVNGDTYNGLYLDPEAKSSGTSETTFTASSTVTTVGNISNGGAQEGPHR
jgi:hypothetical protein